MSELTGKRGSPAAGEEIGMESEASWGRRLSRRAAASINGPEVVGHAEGGVEFCTSDDEVAGEEVAALFRARTLRRLEVLEVVTE